MWGKVSFHRSRKPAPPGPGAQHIEKLPRALPLPQKPPHSTLSASRPGSDHRVASSAQARAPVDQGRQRSTTWSYQNEDRFYRDPGTAAESASVDISPPDSPIFINKAHHSGESSRVSSLEIDSKQAFDRNPETTRYKSNLPILRQRADSAQLNDRPSTQDPSSRNRTTRRDDFTAPSAVQHSDNPALRTAGNASFETQPTRSRGLTGWAKDQYHTREQNAGGRGRSSSKNDNPFSLAMREPWKGQSGRTPMINPIQEKPRGRSSSRGPRSSNTRSSEKDRTSPNHAYLGLVPSVVTTITGGAEKNNPASTVKRWPSRSRHQDSTPQRAISPAIIRNDAPPRIDLPKPDLEATLAGLELSTGDQAHEPVSRFSATTCATTETRCSTPSRRDSIDAASQNTDNAPSIMSRKRPVASAVVPGKKPTRKPTPSQSAGNTSELSQCSPEEQAHARIEQLEARRDNLTRRRENIDTIIHELTQVIQPSSLAYDMAAREEVKKTVASLNNELAEIKREEHEIGLKLFRAWKKRDERALYGGDTSLWVKRVTS
ncbi:uncharacterized protein ACLA_038400 [Aspergillus clavatus NRRL 1]|uniref:Uncharacterized protein n=1 Tax=Aspergillus clavatus (strain ATCC 1007 / CBS 513.65 / DSM 816 / NCTC 3887 / NRRL 1 / QM 1276 / 107) TaxID=344612 RepID=A1CKF5_ASPCL|nr:uncharacterized protein ACLA_038400 [Aspergillus clavatus NRRL 1]EAW09629.1 conserved hypothetical protein [Aspergillus clavatus NRRL 1]